VLAPNAAAGQLGRRDQPTRSKGPIVVHITCPGRYRHLGTATRETSGNVNQRGNAGLVCAVCPPVTSRAKYTSAVPKHTSAALRPGVGTGPTPPVPPPRLHATGDPLPWRDPARRRRVPRAGVQTALRARRTPRRNARFRVCRARALPTRAPARPPVSSLYLSRPSVSGLCGANAEEKGVLPNYCTNFTKLAPALPTHQMQPRRMVGW
jgi:hypothetical protein